MLARTDSSETTLFYSNLVGAVVMLPVLPFVWTTPTDPLVIVLMVAVGAHRRLRALPADPGPPVAPASVLSPFIYTQIVWATRSATWCSATCRTAGPSPAPRS